MPKLACIFALCLNHYLQLLHNHLQDDLLYESLTVYETLYYAAMLRLPQHMDHTAKTTRVDTVITALGLSSCKNTIIGNDTSLLSHTFSWHRRLLTAQTHLQSVTSMPVACGR